MVRRLEDGEGNPMYSSLYREEASDRDRRPKDGPQESPALSKEAALLAYCMSTIMGRAFAEEKWPGQK